MKLAEYQVLASRTCPNLETPEHDILHMRMGVISELGELVDAYKKHIAYKKPLDFTNVREEIADICWYLVNEMRFHELTINFDFTKLEMNFSERLQPVQAAHAITVGLTDAYLKITEAPSMTNYYEYLKALYQLCHHLGIDFYVALDLNIKKLQARYPEKFSEEAALNRDLTTERKILEGNEHPVS